MRLDSDEMWRAVVSCDGAYDGRFFYAVKTVGVYCRPSCKSRTPLRRNTLVFESAAAAEEAGFRPCKRCRPDLPEYAPSAELAGRVKALIDDCYAERARLTDEMRRLGVSYGHMAALFRECYGLSPTEYLAQTRMKRAKRLLAETDVPIIDIAFDAGFGSLSVFYGFFKKREGVTPGQYRRTVRGENA